MEEAVKRGPGRPPKSSSFSGDEEIQVGPAEECLIGKDIASVRFHVGAQFLATVKTGLNAKNDSCRLTRMPGSVMVRIHGRRFEVPFSNVICIEYSGAA